MEKEVLNLTKLGFKARSKNELYCILTAEGNLYLPPLSLCTVDFIANILDEKKKILESGKVIVRRLSHIKGLRALNYIEFLIEQCNRKDYLPDDIQRRLSAETG